MIEFTQYLRPNGRRKPITINRSIEVEERAERLIMAGLRFEAEVLTTGEVSLTVFDQDSEEDVAIELTPNGDHVGAAVDKLVDQAINWLDGREERVRTEE